ncbi:MAG TPA: condensation domain-containing protein, partial [Verrucomicrobiae bacterium]|nr:condensation domain-containing protein [Verrucomicrobiae bacterium]
PAPGPDRPHLAAEYTPPADALETHLASMWQDVLRLDRIGVRDDFFELGGDSIRATQLVARVREALDTDIRVGALFDAPTIARLAERIRATARAAPPARLDGPATTAERPAGSDRRIPLSFAQRRLWFLDRLEPGSAVYNVSAALRLKGPLDVSAFRRAFDGIVRRHEPLRTSFGEEEGKPFQIVHPAPDGDAPVPAAGVPRLELIDLGALDSVRREGEALELAQEEARAPFDLERGPLARARLVRLAVDDHLLLISFHHAVADGWSTGIFLDEMAGLYAALREGRSSPLVAPVSRFADHAEEQQQALESGALDAEIAWWKEALGGLQALDLPADRTRPALPSFRGARVAVSIEPRIVAALRELGRRCGATLFMTLLAAFETLLHRWSGQTDFCVGTAVSGRPRRQLEGTIGFFANTLPLRGDLSGDPPFTELLARVRRRAIEAFERQQVPFERIVEELRPTRDLSRQPLFQVMFAFQSARGAAPGFPGISATFLELDPATSKFDLTLSLAESEGEVAGMLEYSTDLFDAATLRALAGQFGTLLRSIASTPSRRLSELPLSTDEERRGLLLAATSSGGETPGGRIGGRPWTPLHERLADRAREVPDAVAVAFRDERLTYRGLEDRIRIVSEGLRALGAVPGSLVAVCAGRSVEMVVGIVGALRSGSAYVPIDPAWPEARIAAVLEDARPAAVLATTASAGRLPRPRPPIFLLDGPPAPGGAREGRGAAVRPGDLAYVLYTSGSTGRPKGVEVTHAGLLR